MKVGSHTQLDEQPMKMQSEKTAPTYRLTQVHALSLFRITSC